jgi:hypothetical protein
MFSWFKKKPQPPADGELREYMKAVEDHRDHPVMARWFHQITPCQLSGPGGTPVTFTMIEFRDGSLGAMAWNDGRGNWGTGGWRPLSPDGLMAIDIRYLQDAPAAPGFPELLQLVAARRAEVTAA